MISAQCLVNTLLEEVRQTLVGVSGPDFPNGFFTSDLETLKTDLARSRPEYTNTPVDKIVNSLIQRGNTLIVAGHGEVRVLSNSPTIRMKPEFAQKLEDHMGLSGYPTVGYSAHYDASPVAYATQRLFKFKPNVKDIEFTTDLNILGKELEKKIGMEKFAHQVDQWPRFTARELATHYGKLLGQNISPEDMTQLALRFEKNLRSPTHGFAKPKPGP